MRHKAGAPRVNPFTTLDSERQGGLVLLVLGGFPVFVFFWGGVILGRGLLYSAIDPFKLQPPQQSSWS